MMPADKFRKWQDDEKRAAIRGWYWYFGLVVVVIVLGELLFQGP